MVYALSDCGAHNYSFWHTIHLNSQEHCPGSASVFVTATDVPYSGCGSVTPGGDFVRFGSGSSSSDSSAASMGMGSTGFPTSTELNINGQAIKLHTSCSRPLGVGTTVGQLALVEFVTGASRCILPALRRPLPPTSTTYIMYSQPLTCSNQVHRFLYS